MSGVEIAAGDVAGAFLRDEASANEHLDMPRDRLQRDVEGRGKFGDERRSLIEPREDGATIGIAQSEEEPVERASSARIAPACLT